MISKQIPTTPGSVVQQTKEAQVQAERMNEVLLLLENLMIREEMTAKAILGYLYDVGSINLINRKFHRRSINQLMKWIARFSKPVFKIIALRWVKRNSPELITKWLYSQVQFKPRVPQPALPASETVTVQSTTLKKIEDYNQEISRLHARIKVLTTLLFGAVLSMGGAIAWAFWHLEAKPLSLDPIHGAIAVPAHQNAVSLVEACK